MNRCPCGVTMLTVRAATIPGSIDTKFVTLEVCEHWLDHEVGARRHPHHELAVAQAEAVRAARPYVEPSERLRAYAQVLASEAQQPAAICYEPDPHGAPALCQCRLASTVTDDHVIVDLFQPL